MNNGIYFFVFWIQPYFPRHAIRQCRFGTSLDRSKNRDSRFGGIIDYDFEFLFDSFEKVSVKPTLRTIDCIEWNVEKHIFVEKLYLNFKNISSRGTNKDK